MTTHSYSMLPTDKSTQTNCKPHNRHDHNMHTHLYTCHLQSWQHTHTQTHCQQTHMTTHSHSTYKQDHQTNCKLHNRHDNNMHSHMYTHHLQNSHTPTQTHCMPQVHPTRLTDEDELTMLTRVMMDLEMRVSARWTHASCNNPKRRSRLLWSVKFITDVS